MIVVKIMGGFGNQLFQYATGRALALHLNTELKLDFDFFDTEEKRKVMRLQYFKIPYSLATKKDTAIIKNKENPIYLKNILTKLGIKISPFYKPNHILEDGVFELLKKKESSRSYYIEGWMGDERYFKDIRDLLLKEININFSPETENFRLQSFINSVNSVAVHIRRGDYLKNTYFKTLPVEYYTNAMNEIKRKLTAPHFFFFSDDMDWVKQNFSTVENAHFIENNNKKETQWSTIGDIEDLMLIKSCKHQIIANSTFSWWGAWLNNNNNKNVCFPSIWYNDAIAQQNFLQTNFIPNNWTRINIK